MAADVVALPQAPGGGVLRRRAGRLLPHRRSRGVHGHQRAGAARRKAQPAASPAGPLLRRLEADLALRVPLRGQARSCLLQDGLPSGRERKDTAATVCPRLQVQVPGVHQDGPAPHRRGRGPQGRGRHIAPRRGRAGPRPLVPSHDRDPPLPLHRSRGRYPVHDNRHRAGGRVGLLRRNRRHRHPAADRGAHLDPRHSPMAHHGRGAAAGLDRHKGLLRHHDNPLAHWLDRHGPGGARQVPRPAHRGLRDSGPPLRRRPDTDHVPPHAALLLQPHNRLRHARRPRHDPWRRPPSASSAWA